MAFYKNNIGELFDDPREEQFFLYTINRAYTEFKSLSYDEKLRILKLPYLEIDESKESKRLIESCDLEKFICRLGGYCAATLARERKYSKAEVDVIEIMYGKSYKYCSIYEKFLKSGIAYRFAPILASFIIPLIICTIFIVPQPIPQSPLEQWSSAVIWLCVWVGYVYCILKYLCPKRKVKELLADEE